MSLGCRRRERVAVWHSETPRAGGQSGLEVSGSLLPGPVHHVVGNCDQVDDANERLEHHDKGSDPEAHLEKPTEPTKGPSETLNSGGGSRRTHFQHKG